MKQMSYLSQLASLLNRESKLLNAWLGLIFNHLVDEGEDVVALHSEQDEGWPRVTVSRRVGACHATRVDKVFAVVLSDTVLVRVPAHQNIAV